MKDEVAKLILDSAEAVLDSKMADGLLKEIPILGSAVSVLKISASIPDQLFAAKIKRMIAKLAEVSESERLNFAQDVLDKEDARKKVAEVVLFALNGIDDLQKADYLAYLLCAFAKGEITMLEFVGRTPPAWSTALRRSKHRGIA